MLVRMANRLTIRYTERRLRGISGALELSEKNRYSTYLDLHSGSLVGWVLANVVRIMSVRSLAWHESSRAAVSLKPVNGPCKLYA